MTIQRDRGVQVGERFIVVELPHLREHPGHDSGKLADGLLEDLEVAKRVIVARAFPWVLVEERLGALRPGGGRVPHEGQVVGRLESSARALEVVTTFLIDETGRGTWP